MTERLTRFEIYSHDHQLGFDRRAGSGRHFPGYFQSRLASQGKMNFLQEVSESNILTKLARIIQCLIGLYGICVTGRVCYDKQI